MIAAGAPWADTPVAAAGPSSVERSDDSIVGVLLGAQLASLAPVVRTVHAMPRDTWCQGTLWVRQARSRVGRMLARSMHLPRSTGNTPVTLSIRRPGAGCSRSPHERWHRSFGGEIMASDQTTDGHLLLEHMGHVELAFELRVADRRLVLHQVRARARLGARSFPLPRWMAPRVEASVGPSPAGDQIDVSVCIGAPLVGTLISYRGSLTPQDSLAPEDAA